MDLSDGRMSGGILVRLTLASPSPSLRLTGLNLPDK